MLYILFILNVHQRLMGRAFCQPAILLGSSGDPRKEKGVRGGSWRSWRPAFAGNIGTRPLPLSLLPRHLQIMRFFSNILCPLDAHHSPKAPVTQLWSEISAAVSKSSFGFFEGDFLRDFCCSNGKLTQLPPWEVSPQ